MGDFNGWNAFLLPLLVSIMGASLLLKMILDPLQDVGEISK